jgi:hypothetical protein
MDEAYKHGIRRGSHALPPAVYEIRVKGQLTGSNWSAWFEGMELTVTGNGETLLRGMVADQAALYGLLARLRDLALPLLAVNRCELLDPAAYEQ